jgi:hypothetical protein
MLDILTSQLELDPELQPIATNEVGSFSWDFYTFELQGNPADLAIAENGEKVYFLLMISDPGEHEVMYEGLFLPAVEAMRVLE